ncbi:Multicopper oxidase [Ceratobasidium sp. AG-Ba]|nr:Multicopper oxidase [Ceratobasidium sp. AG-Ba]
MVRSLVQATAVLSFFASSAFAGTVKYVFDVANGNIAPDGVTRNAILVNNKFPGTLITANKGDTLQIVVNNQLTNSTMRRSTTIHWHGLFQRGNAEEDGPAFCPIAPQASYTYTIPLNGQSGTYWYHSHLASQYVDGLRGSMVIYPQDPYRSQYDVDDESTVFTLADWYHDSAKEIEESHVLARTIPDSATINGKGRYDPLNLTVTPDNFYTLKVKRGKCYRFRITNISAIASFIFGVQNHTMKVIEMDGGMTKPMLVNQIDVLVGQRYSAILCADQPSGSYWINAPVTNVLQTTAQALLVYEDVNPWRPPKGPFWTWTISQAVADYWKHHHGHHRRGHMARTIGGSKGASGLEMRAPHRINPHTEIAARSQYQQGVDAKSVSGVVLDETQLAPLANPGACGAHEPVVKVDVNFALNFATGLWMINNSSYKSPDVPTLLQILTGHTNFMTSENTYTLPRGACVEIHIFGISLGIVHPFHLHGHLFDVVQFGNSTINLVNPPRRDVVGVTDSGVRIRFRTDNPGPWFLHCHIDWHLVEGLAAVFAEAPSDIPKVVRPDPAWKDLCSKYDALSPDLQ